MLEAVAVIFSEAASGAQLLIAIGLILVVGALAGRLANIVKLPTVTGYIAVGILIGPYGLGILSHELMTEHLRVFADIALMIIAFSIGKLLDLRFTHIDYKRPIIIPSAEAFGAFAFVTGGILLLSLLPVRDLVPHEGSFLTFTLPLALMLGAIAIATAPASTLAVVKEYGAETLLTRCLMISVAVDNALAIGVFGIVAVLVQDVFLASAPAGILSGVLMAVGRIIGALLWGALVAVLLHPFIERQKEHAPALMLTLGTILFCAGVAELLQFPSMLAGISLGMVMSNSYRSDREAFAALEKFEPPLFAIFFVIAGAHFDFAAFTGSAAILVTYIVARMAGKYLCARVATKALRVEDSLHNFLGLTLVPQAGIAIGLVFVVQSIPEFQPFWSPVTTVVLTAVAISEIIGPPLTHWALTHSGKREVAEAHESALREHQGRRGSHQP